MQKVDRPREKLYAKGPAALSDFELLQALIGSGNAQADVVKIAKETKKLLDKHGADITYNDLQQVTGLGPARITEILAAYAGICQVMSDTEALDDHDVSDKGNRYSEQQDTKKQSDICRDSFGHVLCQAAMNRIKQKCQQYGYTNRAPKRKKENKSADSRD